MSNLNGKTVIVTGSSRGIGRAIVLRCAQDGANIVIAAKTAEPHPTLLGTIFSVAEEAEQLGARTLPYQIDLRNEAAIEEMIAKTVEQFGGVDILINNASAIHLAPTIETPMKRFDLMMAVNARATYACSRAALPYLHKASNPHILNLSPPLSMKGKWFKNHVAYTMSKYGMSMCTLGMSAEFKAQGIAVNSLWPKTTIATAAVEVNFPKEILQASRKADIMSDAAYEIITADAKDTTGNFFIDEEVLRATGVTDFDRYALNPGTVLYTDLYIDRTDN